mgnify:CR=1 FL=1
MAKYRILKREYPNGQIDYEVQKKILGLFWWNFNNIDAVETGIYGTLEEAKRAIEIDKGAIKITIINVE